MKVNDLVQVGVETKEIVVSDYDEEGKIIGEHIETRDFPIMQNVTRDMTDEETAQFVDNQNFIYRVEPNLECKVNALMKYLKLQCKLNEDGEFVMLPIED